MKVSFRKLLGLLAVLSLVAAACGSGDEVDAASGAAGTAIDATLASSDAPTVAVTTNILGDVVANLVGSEMNVMTIMPVGADPHDFQASAQQVAAMGDAAVLVANGAAFEEGLLDVIETAETDGVPVFEAIWAVETIEFGEGGDVHGHDDDEDGDVHDDEDKEDKEDKDGDVHDDDEDGDVHDDDEDGDVHDDEDEDGDVHDEDEDGDVHDDEDEDEDGHDDDEDEDGHGHEDDGADPHFFTDPARVALAADGIADFLIENVDGIDADTVRANTDAYVAELNALDEELSVAFADLSDEQRVLVTNHEVFGYFADRYDFEVVGTVIPSGSTDGADAQALAELAEIIEDEGVPAIFADTSSSDELAQTLADEVGDIDVIELFSESLGDESSGGATYVEMVRTNADRILAALAA